MKDTPRTAGAGHPGLRRSTGRIGPRGVVVAAVLLCVVVAVVVMMRSAADLRADQVFLFDETTCFIANAPELDARLVADDRPLAMTIHTDADGLRVSASPPPAHTTARCRVLATGDSFTYGAWVEAEESYPAMLETFLTARGHDVAVDNAGMLGHTIADERIAALGRWAALGHDVVTVAATANDLGDLLRLEAIGCEIGGTPPVTFDLSVDDVAAPLALHLAARNVVARVVAFSPTLRARSSGPAIPPATREEQDHALEVYLAELERLATALEARGTHLLYVMLEPPGFPPAAGELRVPFPLERVRAIVEGSGGVVVDASALFLSPDSRLTPHDAHPSPRGHRAIASAMAAAIVEAGWLGACR